MVAGQALVQNEIVHLRLPDKTMDPRRHPGSVDNLRPGPPKWQERVSRGNSPVGVPFRSVIFPANDRGEITLGPLQMPPANSSWNFLPLATSAIIASIMPASATNGSPLMPSISVSFRTTSSKSDVTMANHLFRQASGPDRAPLSRRNIIHIYNYTRCT